jgi:hypothetical protein
MRISVHLTICFIGIFAVPADYLDWVAFTSASARGGKSTPCVALRSNLVKIATRTRNVQMSRAAENLQPMVNL